MKELLPKCGERREKDVDARLEYILGIKAMIVLYQASGAGDFYLSGSKMPAERIRTLKHNVSRLLTARNKTRATQLLESFPFEIIDSSNFFNDDFSVLYANVPLDQYEQLGKIKNDFIDRIAFKDIAATFTELGTYIRFIAAELKMESAAQPSMTKKGQQGLRNSEIHKLVNNYIGVEGGYLGDFSYRTHRDFYIELDLDINPFDYEGTTRERFIKIVSESEPKVQAKILKGILDRYPPGSSKLRTQDRYDEIHGWIGRLSGMSQIEHPTPRITSDVVERALTDAKHLLQSTGATSGVDRAHTAIHGYLRAVCKQTHIECKSDANLNELFKLVLQHHPGFKDAGHRKEDIDRILKALSTILDALNPLRNRASVAHPNEELLKEAEAMLVINSAWTILHYIDAKVKERSS